MARPRSEHTLLVKEKLIARLSDGFHPPGRRFFSNRGLARQFGVSYQTAHRLIQELETEGWLRRRAAAGTYVAGPVAPLAGVNLIFNDRAERPGSFGARLRRDLEDSLRVAGIKVRATSPTETSTSAPDWLPVLWECPRMLSALAAQRRFGIVLNDRPPPGLAATFIDSVATDDFSGGVAAGELLRGAAPSGRLGVLGGPSTDRRSQERVAGFLAHVPDATVVWAGSWFAEDAGPAASRLVGLEFTGVFCCNDRLASAVLATGTTAFVVGFDDAPVAEPLNLTTIAVPWAQIVAAAVEIVQRRMRGDTGAAAQIIFAPRPVTRASCRRGDHDSEVL